MRSAAILLVVLMIWAAGLLAFAARVDRSTPPPEPDQADGIIALTGASNARILAAMSLLENGKARRLLISGVNKEATRADIKGVAKATKAFYDCCVDLGFEATDTVGNAREAAEWTRARGYRSLIVVTSDFHMPRALLELRATMPHIAMTPYPIRTEELDAHSWWRTPMGARRMVLEYCKYLAILAREGFLKLGPQDRPANTTQAGAKT